MWKLSLNCKSSVLSVGSSWGQGTSVHSRIHYKITLETYRCVTFLIVCYYCNFIEEVVLLLTTWNECYTIVTFQHTRFLSVLFTNCIYHCLLWKLQLFLLRLYNWYMSALHFCHVYFRNFTLGVCTLIVLAVINKLISFLEFWMIICTIL